VADGQRRHPERLHPARRSWWPQAGALLCAWAWPSLQAQAMAVPDERPSEPWHSRFELGLADWRGIGPAWGRDNLSLHDDAEVPGRVLRVRLHGGAIDPGSMTRRGRPRSGAGFKARVLAGGSDIATLRYRLRFAPDFEFVRGGKLPGLFGGTGPSGGSIPDGHDGFSLRLMWRELGRGEVYAYLPTSRVHGSSLLAGRLRFVPGRWHEIVQAVALNTPGRADGRLALWQDGRPLGELPGLRLRDTARLRVDGVFFEVFHGGADESWAPRRDSHIDFADFALEPGWPQELPR
jgi:hypothetical protein